jgi:beta-lactamase superfamily II metal-dependent hydrolase
LKSSEISYKQAIKTESDEKPPIIRIAFLDVGQADTIVISCPDTREAVVVDCVDADAVLDYLEAERITHLRGVIITHLHADHFSGVTSLLENYHRVAGLQECEVVAFNEIIDTKNIDKLIRDPDNHDEGTNRSVVTSLRNLLRWCKQDELEGKQRCANLKVERRSLPFEGTMARSLHLMHPYLSDFLSMETRGLNNVSGVLHITGPGSSALLTGDLEPEGWQLLKRNHPQLHSDVLKFPHHGAWKDSHVDALLDSIQPSIVIISVGSEGHKKYKHPNAHVFEALSARPDIHLLCTQATDQCQEHVQQKRVTVMSLLKAQADKSSFPIIGSKQGCPCAGTIIIELGQEVRIIQPEIKFHRETIIKPNFKRRKCVIEYELPVEAPSPSSQSRDI